MKFDKPIFMNYAGVKSDVKADDIPILIPDEAWEGIKGTDEKPFFKVESIEYPVKGNGGIYTEPFFASFVEIMNSRPIPGSKEGHGWKDRMPSDIYTIGGKLDKNGDGSGVVHFKVYFPKNGENSSNEALIRDAKAGIVNFSLVTLPEYTIKINEDNMEIKHFTKTRGYERNDAVEYGAGAMLQTVNSSTPRTVREFEKALRDAGYSRAQAVAVASKGFGAIENTNNQEDSDMEFNKENVLSWLKTNSGIPVSEIAEAMGQSDRILNKAEFEALKTENAEMKQKLDDAAELHRKNRLDAEFGAEGEVRELAEMVLNSTSDEEIEKFKNSAPAKALAANSADYTKQPVMVDKKESRDILDEWRV